MPFYIIIFFSFFFFYMRTGPWTPTLAKFLRFYSLHCYSHLNVFFFLAYLIPSAYNRGTVNINTKNVGYCGRNCFLIAKDSTGTQSLLELCECQLEEHWMKKKKQVRAWRESDGVEELGEGGGYDIKIERKDASSFNMYSWENSERRKGQEKGKGKFCLSWA